VTLLGVVGKTLDGRFQIADERELRARRQIVEQRGGLFEEERQVVFDARGRYAIADVFIDRGAARVALEDLAPTAAEGGAGGFVEGEFAAGQQAHVFHRIEAALRVGVERADRVDLIVEQIDPVRQRRAHRKQVEQRTAHAVLAGAHNLADVLVACQRQLGLQLGLVETLALRERERVARHERGGRHAVQGRGGGHQQDVAAAFAEVVERGETLGDEILVRREGIVRQRFPVGQEAHTRLRSEESDFLREALGVDGARADDGEQRHLFAIGEVIAGDQQGIG
jgi:hypothetical protein